MLGQPRSVQIAAFQDPQHEALAKPPGDASGKPRRGGGVFLVGAGAMKFMDGAKRQPAARQDAIDRRDSKRQHPVPQRARPFDPADAVLQGDEGGGG